MTIASLSPTRITEVQAFTARVQCLSSVSSIKRRESWTRVIIGLLLKSRLYHSEETIETFSDLRTSPE